MAVMSATSQSPAFGGSSCPANEAPPAYDRFDEEGAEVDDPGVWDPPEPGLGWQQAKAARRYCVRHVRARERDRQWKRTSSIWKANGPGGGPPTNINAMRSCPSIPPNADNGNVYCFHSDPATKSCISGVYPLL